MMKCIEPAIQYCIARLFRTFQVTRLLSVTYSPPLSKDAIIICPATSSTGSTPNIVNPISLAKHDATPSTIENTKNK